MTKFDYRDFWRDVDGSDIISEPIKGITRPEYFMVQDDITEMMVSTIQRYLPSDKSILEIGCNTGRTLAGLKRAGYSNLMGVEISQVAIDMGRDHFPELKGVPIRCAPIEDVIWTLPNYDLIFTIGVLMHLPPESNWIHREISNHANKNIITMEMELPAQLETYGVKLGGGIFTWFRGSYEKIFYEYGWRQIEGHSCEEQHILSKNHWLRVFRHG